MPVRKLRLLIRNLVLELVIYAVLLVGYFFLVLRYLGELLADLFRNQTLVYAFIGLGLIVTQGVLLEILTSLLIRMLRLDRYH